MKSALPRPGAGRVSVSLLLAVLAWTGYGAPTSQAQQTPSPRTSYKGREIAQTMSFHGAPWLLRPEREEEEEPAKLLKALRIRKGQRVADIGCGNGFYSLRMARLAGPEGRVLAVDIQPEMLSLLRDRAKQASLENIEPVLGQPFDPKLPKGRLDLILLVDVYHEFAYPERMLAAMRESLKPNGVIALAEYRSEDPKVPIRQLHKMSKQQILKEFAPNGLRLAREYDRLPWQHLMFFKRK